MALAAAVALSSPLLLSSTGTPASATPPTPNAVVTWDALAQESIWDVAQQGPHVQARSFSIIHGAIYDAVNAIARKPYQPYLGAPPATGSESVDAAVATAAFRTLEWLFPAQQAALQTKYDNFMAGVPNGSSKTAGAAIGQKTANTMIAFRTNDGAFGSRLWREGTGPGQWRRTPPGFGSDGGWVMDLKPFLIPDATMFTTSGPPALTSAQYTRDFNEVKAIGAANSTIRTPDQTDSARWWHDRRLTEWEIKRQLAVKNRLTNLQAARMFAMVDMTEMDALIACYYEKYRWSFWRPFTSIPEAGTDGNPNTVADPAWTPLLITPPHPDYTSGHACFTAASMGALAYFYGTDRMSFSATSADTGTTRHFDRFSEAVAEVIEARIWGGIHTRTADVQGALIGARTLAYMIPRYFRPTR
ncbi:vanadium-dependent haloperoxidase [Phytohabitans flavus]